MNWKGRLGSSLSVKDRLYVSHWRTLMDKIFTSELAEGQPLTLDKIMGLFAADGKPFRATMLIFNNYSPSSK